MYLPINAISIDKKLMDLLISCEIEATVHSVFHRAINLQTSDCNMISIVSKGNGPNTIVVPENFNFIETSLKTGDNVTCTENGLYFHRGVFIRFYNVSLWEHLSDKIINTDKLFRYLTTDKILSKSLFYGIKNENSYNFKLKENFLYFLSFFSSQKKLKQREIIKEVLLSIQSPSIAYLLYEAIISLIKPDTSRGRIKRSLSRIIGTGEGLTPAGDDFVVGLLGVLYYFKRTLLYGEKARNILSVIKEEIDIEKTNFISSRFLSFSLEGRFSQTVLEFLDTLFSASPVDEKSLNTLLSYGSSSGTVIALGILSGYFLFLDKTDMTGVGTTR